MTERILAKIIADSQPPEGARLTTMEVVVPRIVLAEFNTHRVFSRNSASSRAIPVKKMLQRVLEDPYIPEAWGKNQRGMQAGEALSDVESGVARAAWLQARDGAVHHTQNLLALGVHKQTTNRLLEPFMWHTVIVTSTEWSNFLHLRCHTDAHPAIQRTALAMRQVMEESKPDDLDWGDWHCPFVDDRDAGLQTTMDCVKVSSARCARVSYLTHDGVRDPSKDLELHDRLLSAGHMSPFEHPAQASQVFRANQCGNFAWPWLQYRKTIPNEQDINHPRH
jgi:thymidylate synthase ThyX